jgi:chromate reductase
LAGALFVAEVGRWGVRGIGYATSPAEPVRLVCPGPSTSARINSIPWRLSGPTKARRLEKESTMATYNVGYFVGSLSSTSINRELSKALIRLAPKDLEFAEIPIADLPLYSQDLDADLPPQARALKEAIGRSDAILFVTPEYNRSIPGALKNAIDWASRPWGQNSFDQIPAAVIGASPGQIGTAMAQQSLRGVLSYCNARQMTAPEAYIRYTPEIFPGDGEVTDESTKTFLTNYMEQFRTYIIRVLTVIPRA